MTSDAKIGLLLGLIFIFVIAFVINGLPSLRPPVSKVGAMTISPGEDWTSVVGKTEEAVSSLPDAPSQPWAGDEPAPAVEEPKPVVQEPKAVAQETSQSPTANTEGVRSSLPLPSLEKLIHELTPTIQQKDQVATINLDTADRVQEPAPGSGRQAVAAAPQARSEPVPEPKPVETTTKVADTREPAKPASVASKPVIIPGSTIYTAVSGDNLGVIAKKVYGPEEGNRVANIQRIFHANEATLESANKVRVGMKLIIPPALPKLTTATAPATPADVLPVALFERPKTTISEKVQSLSKGVPVATPAATSTPASDVRLYTVQNGDSLWKIAASQLGSGTRCDEIAKLNAEILRSRDTLDVGMKLRLPPK
jgi:nucleoid-associated protein YgaU